MIKKIVFLFSLSCNSRLEQLSALHPGTPRMRKIMTNRRDLIITTKPVKIKALNRLLQLITGGQGKKILALLRNQ